ncbi:hypothetical protein HanRHA438_Chr01g0035061 [Helianthus annuus]|nr:hypothetical protein HanRHA438_Chr01g0035061 [Helianthus annuus]
MVVVLYNPPATITPPNPPVLKKHSLIIIPRSQIQTFTTIRHPLPTCFAQMQTTIQAPPTYLAQSPIFGFNDCDDFEGEVVIGFSFLF